MNYDHRSQLYDRIEEMRGRPLVAYVTSTRQFAYGQMATDVFPEFARQLVNIPADQSAIDLLVVSSGGDPNVAWRIVTMLRERFEHIGVLLPFTAYSAATLLALGANEIVMHPFSNLGPVDPQLTTLRPGQGGMPEAIHFGFEDLVHFLSFVKQDVGLTDQAELRRAFDLLSRDVGGVIIGMGKRSSQLSFSMGVKLLKLHLTDQNEAIAIAEQLNRSFFHHGYPLGRREAKEIGLPVAQPEEELEGLLWDVWESFENEMQCASPFMPLELVRKNPHAAPLFAAPKPPPAGGNGPQGFPPMAPPMVAVEPTPFDLVLAAVESRHCLSDYRTEGLVFASRAPDMQIHVNVVPISQGWKFSLKSDIVEKREGIRLRKPF